MTKTICYCFGYNGIDIQNDVKAHGGKSTILDRIATAKREHTCECDTKHPEKRWCIGDVRRVADEAEILLNCTNHEDSN